LWFVLAYTRHDLRWPARALTAYGVLQGLAVLTLWNDWVLKSSRHITTVRLPWGTTVVYDEAQHGILLNVASVVYLITILIMLVLTARYLWCSTEEDRPRAARLALGIGLFLAVALNDLAVANQIYGCVYLIEYAYGAMVLVMTFGLSSGVLELASTRSELRHSLARLQRILDSVEEVYVETSLEGTILELSPSAKRWLGSDLDLRGRPVKDFYADPGDRERLLAALERDGAVRDFDSTARLPDGRLLTYASNFSLVRDEETGQARIVGSLRDISAQKRAEAERRRLEEKMLQAQKLESLGVLAGGFAHDFNNLLTGILGSAELALDDLPPGHQALRRIDLIREAGRQATALCRQMLAYSGRTAFDLTPLDLSRLVNEMRELLRASASKRVALDYDLATGLPDVVVDPAQLRQIVLNLVINASEAIGDAAGTVTLRTRLEHCSHADLDSRYLPAPLPAGDYVVLEVTDTGSGMDEQTRMRLFDPFFTTKFSGRGLGLAAVLGIVRGHRGTIQVESQPGRGSTFRVLLPASERPASEQAAPTNQGEWRGHGCVLLVDDEAHVREVGKDMLEHLGFEVSVACGGRGAIDMFAASPAAFVLALVDLTMPHLDGIEVTRRLLAIRPELPVLLTSGYTEEESAERGNSAGVRDFVAKPFSLEALRLKLQAALR
jgi:two-component system cell cycle sensor histidine kinase/response regulator CckA